MKRLFSGILAFALMLTVLPTASAANDEAQQAAQELYTLGLFKGTGTDADGAPVFDLDRTPTRAEAVTMLVRLLGKDEEAKNGAYYTDLCGAIFTDVADWAKPYVGYAFDTGLTSGTGEGTFGGEQTVTVTQYLTFVLRALGYASGTDFQWNKAWELSDKIGLTGGEYNANTTNFTRGDVAVISLCTLRTKCKDSDVTLLRSLGLRDVNDVIFTESGINDHGAKYLLLDGKCYDTSAFDFPHSIIKECECSGQPELFIVATRLYTVLDLLEGAYTVEEESSNPFLAGRINADYEKERSYSWEGWYEYLSVDKMVTWRKYVYHGTEFALCAIDDPREEGVMYDVDGVRCFNHWFFTMVSLSDIFEKFGIEGTITITQIDESAFAWSYVK